MRNLTLTIHFCDISQSFVSATKYENTSSNFMFVLPQIAYGNTALIFPSHFQGYNKNEIFADYWDA
jgi:hypothetical protein